MKFLKFLLTGRLSFVLFALLAFGATMLYVEWVNIHQAQERPAHARTR
jgi:hypothetical protein